MRDSILDTKIKKSSKKAKTAETEHAGVLFVPHLSKGDHKMTPKLVCSTVSRWVAARPFATQSWEGSKEWVAYLQSLYAVVDRTGTAVAPASEVVQTSSGEEEHAQPALKVDLEVEPMAAPSLASLLDASNAQG